MIDLVSAFEDFSPDLDEKELQIDADFIVDFLQPFFLPLSRETLAAKVDEIIALEQGRRALRLRPR